MKNGTTEIIRKATILLLECDEDHSLIKQSIDQIYLAFSEITGVTTEDFNRDTDIMLPQGKAISSIAAAHCLLEMKRTAVFLRGINKAVSQRLKETQNGSIRILYAGTGPYGTLIVPLLLLYKPQDITVDILDINPVSLTAIGKVIKALNLDAYIGGTYCTDAVTFTVEHDYDIVISETMQSCLKNEPQVAIMQNLIPQISKQCIFIPEEISIDAYLTNSKMEQDRLFHYDGEQPPFRRIALGNVFKVNKDNLDATRMKNRIAIPDEKETFPILKLFTTVTVFKDEILGENDSSITMPIKFHDFRKEDADEMEFRYIQGVKPKIESEIIYQTQHCI